MPWIPKLLHNLYRLMVQSDYDDRYVHQVNQNESLKLLKELIPNPAWEWPFELDTFQKQAILGLENAKSVFVAAHTSAGKTVVAEYAIAMCHNRGARVIYTSPVKALSNQKYREFKITFGNENVGLLTGDIKTGPNRYILVMTIEILHNMLKNDCPTLRDLEVVIMDEVHYFSDESRGHIWEQILIVLPKRIQLVMLSATVPNTMQFAEWLGRVRQTQIQVISTLKRPVPLEINLFTGTSRNKRNQLFPIMDCNNTFITRGYQLAEETIGANVEKAKKRFQVNPATTKEIDQWVALFNVLVEKDKLPVICFILSKNRIQKTISDLKSVNLLKEVERSNVKKYFKEIIDSKMVNSSDKKLPQIIELEEMLSRGLGMHHAGLLPILKEIVEILFSQGYVKILFATETFAVGVNMPARSVVFDSISKYDGHGQRLLLPGEFTQMAGRAGRRGLDKVGTVIILIKPQSTIYSQDELKRTLIGSACPLESKFKISYNMILSSYRNRQFNMQHMIRHSFIEADRLKKYDDNCKLQQDLSDENLVFMPEYRCKVTFMKDLGFLNSNKDTITLKGRIACEIESCETVVTEIILSGLYHDAQPWDIAASLSCLISESNLSSDFRLNENTPSMQKILKKMFNIVGKINKSQENFNIFEQKIKTNCCLVKLVIMWAKGAEFADIVNMAEVQIGDIVRCLQRIYEILCHCESAANLLKDFELSNSFVKAQKCIYRGVVSASSIYVDDV